MNGSYWTLLNYAFRPFFLFGGLYAVLVMLIWVLALHGIFWWEPVVDTPGWHAHEMLIGFASGAVAGFVLTAVATWTGRTPVQGPWLGALVGGWLAGRIAMCCAGVLPPALVGLLDMIFPILLTLLAAREIVGGNSKRNYIVIVLLGSLALFNLLYHSASTSLGARAPLYLILHTLLILVSLISGRIVPSFTANWLRSRGETRLPAVQPKLDLLVLIAGAVTGLVDSFWQTGIATALLAFITAAVHAARFRSWRTLATLSNPLLLILHVAYLWFLIGYLLLGLSALGIGLPRSAALHALSMGAVGGMILAVATRVGLAHTGRALQASRLTVVAYVVFAIAVIVRIVSPLAPARYQMLLDLSATGWMVTFALFLWVYAPMVIRPRVDGRPERPAAASNKD